MISPEQKKYIMEQAEKALKDYQQHEGVGSCPAGYNVLRYARMGLYEVKEIEE